jgi:heme/copper-type cytochrome/quinol oxidase subunit 3
MLTGLHGLHVIAGTLFLLVGLIRLYRDSFSSEHHLGVEFSILYWHLVDILLVSMLLILGLFLYLVLVSY